MPLELVQRAADGDRSAQDAVLEANYDYVRRSLLRLLGPVGELDDLQQQVLMRIVATLPRWRQTAAFSTWVGGICVNVAREFLKARRRRGTMVSLESPGLQLEAVGGETVEGTVEARELLQQCFAILEQLSDSHRVVFVLKAVGHSIDEIASMMGSANSTTRLRLFYARKAFLKAAARQPDLASAARRLAVERE